MNDAGNTTRWEAHPIRAALLRTAVVLAPFAISIAFVHLASSLVPMPTSSLWIYLAWWLGLSGSATLVLIACDKLFRRLLPLVALYKLSLVFPDRAPSRIRTAMRSRTVGTLEERVAAARDGRDATPVEAAERLLALVADLSDHDRLTRGHADRVRGYAQMIGEELHLPADDLDRLTWAALLHDVGKLGVPGKILTKPGRPSDAEWQALKRHPEIGEELVAPLREWLGEWADAVGHHHERWDGGGYPHRLAGDAIGLAGRIVAVADVFDVITSARSYKEPGGADAARKEIADCAGSQFDPRVVRAFLGVSLGRLRFAMGPLSWLAHAPMLGRLPLTPAIGSVAGALATVGVAVSAGLVAAPEPAATQPVAPPPVVRAAEVAPPVAELMDEDGTLVVEVPGGTGSGALASLRIVEQPHAGRAVATSAGGVLYVPPRDFSGSVTVRYEACTKSGRCTRGTIRITVREVNDPPDARDDSARTATGVAVVIDVLANDLDPDGDPLTIGGILGTSVGTVLVSGGRVTWAPPRGFVGTASFRYRALDGRGGRDDARVIVVVGAAPPAPSQPGAPQAPVPSGAAPAPPAAAPAPQPPGSPAPPTAPSAPKPSSPASTPPPPPAANLGPRAVDDTAVATEGETITIDVLANDSDPDGDVLRLSSVGTPSLGTVTKDGDRIRFTTPRSGGSAAFAYVVADPSGAVDTGRVTVRIAGVNDPPSFVGGGDRSVLEDAGPQSVGGWASGISPGPPDEAAQTVRFTVSSDNGALFAAGGRPTVSLDGTLTFTPAPDASGRASVTVRAVDDGGTVNGGSDMSAPVSFIVAVGPVNDPPTFSSGSSRTVPKNAAPQSVSGWASGISPGPADEAGQTVGFSVSSDNAALFASGGQPTVSSSGTLVFAPAANTTGVASVTVRAVDDGGTANGGRDRSSPVTFKITVTGGVNGSPVAVDDGPSVPRTDSAGVTFAVLANDTDPDGDSLLLGSFDGSTVTDGALTSNGGGSFTYVPSGSFTGTESFDYVVSDGNGGTDTGTVTITVTAVNSAPVAVDDGPSVPRTDSAGVTFAVLANDTDPDGDSLLLGSFDGSTVTDGALTSNGGGSFTYVPSGSFTGTESFDYVVSDGNGGTDTGTVTITVTAVNSAPVAVDDGPSVPRTDSAGVTFAVLANDTDPDGDSLLLGSFDGSTVTDGALTSNGGGSFTYVPSGSFTGTESFDYVVSDGNGGTDTGTVTITVTAVNSAPLAAGDAYSTLVRIGAGDPGLSVAAPGVLENDSDEDGDTLTLQTTPIVPPANGTLTLSADGSFIYTPSVGFSGTDGFTYRISDGNGGTADGSVTITVQSVFTPFLLYLGTSGPSSEVWSLSGSAPGTTGSVPDLDGDGNPGLTIKSSGGGENESDPLKVQTWTYVIPSTIQLNGPVTLHLYATPKNFDDDDKVHPHVYLYDCDAGGSCTKIAENDVHVDEWNDEATTWTERSITVGSVARTIAAGRELRLKLLVQHTDTWLALTGDYPSGLELTLGT